MLPLFRNPLFSLLRRFWGLPIIIPALAWGFGGLKGLELALEFLVTCLVIIIGIVGTALAHGWYAKLRESIRRRVSGYKFLCPSCLHFGDFHFACGACGAEVEPFLVNTCGVYVNDCLECHQPLFSEREGNTAGPKAYCPNCLDRCERNPHHSRRVRVVATILSRDFDLFCCLPGAQKGQARDGTQFLYLDDGSDLSFVLDLSDLQQSRDTKMPAHASLNLEAIWLDAAGAESLELARAVDAFLRTPVGAAIRQADVSFCLRQEEPDPVLENRLEAQFQRVRCGIEPMNLLSSETPPLLGLDQSVSSKSANDIVPESRS